VDDFEAYVRSRGDRHLRLACLLVGDAHEAQDLVQTVLAKLAPRWAVVAASENVDAYVNRALANAASSWWRWRRRHSETLVAVVPDHAATNNEVDQRNAVMQLMRQLPPRQRTVLVLRYYEQLNEREIAEAIGCSVGTVKSQSAKARATLRRRWLELYPDTDGQRSGTHA
jgi:RNA polymerase sigma-70 factor (sigma-E family)